MNTGYDPERIGYIAYITKNYNFSIQNAEFTLRNFIESYGDILISVGSDFTENDYIHNRGLARNPHWVLEGRYSGLSMSLFGGIGAVVDAYFPEKTEMHLVPLGSIQCILKKTLLPEEGYIMQNSEKVCLTSVEVSPDDDEGGMIGIKISALARIYNRD